MEETIEEEVTRTEVPKGLDSQFILMLTRRSWTNCFKLGSSIRL
jgi:hypothetical protein